MANAPKGRLLGRHHAGNSNPPDQAETTVAKGKVPRILVWLIPQSSTADIDLPGGWPQSCIKAAVCRIGTGGVTKVSYCRFK